MDTVAIAPAAGAAGQNPLLSPGEKYSCPHATQDFFPPYCDAQGRCHLDFPSEYRHSDIYLEGDPAMKKSLSALCLACVLLAMPACQNDNFTNLDRFTAKWKEYLAGEMNDDEMLALADQALAGDAKGDPLYTLSAYMTRGNIFFKQGDHKGGVENFQQGLKECLELLVDTKLQSNGI